jgi:hypothetical protein
VGANPRSPQHLAETSHGLKTAARPSSYPFMLQVRCGPFGLFCAGALAQLGERLICIQEVRSSILLGSTRLCGWRSQGSATLAAWPLGTCLRKVQWIFLSGGAGTACGSVAQVVRAHA